MCLVFRCFFFRFGGVFFFFFFFEENFFSLVLKYIQYVL